PASQLLRQPAARRPDSALPAEGHGPAPRAHAAFLDGALLRAAQCLQYVARGNLALPDVVEGAIVGLRNQRVHRADLLVPGQGEKPGGGRGADFADTARTREHDPGVQRPQVSTLK